LTRARAACTVAQVTISDFLLKLAREPSLLEEFRKDPGRISREHDLDEQQLQVLLAADLSELRVKIKAELQVEGEHVAFITIHAPPPTPPTPPTPPAED
jgi:hypothetical protein